MDDLSARHNTISMVSTALAMPATLVAVIRTTERKELRGGSVGWRSEAALAAFEEDGFRWRNGEVDHTSAKIRESER